MSLQTGGSPAPPITLDHFHCVVGVTYPADWRRLGNWLVLRSNPDYRIHRVTQDCNFDAPWLLPHPDFDPHLFHYTLYYRCHRIADVPMVQVHHGLELPLPRSTSAGLLIEFHHLQLAWLVNDDFEELEGYTRAANILLPALMLLERNRPYVGILDRLPSISLARLSRLIRLWNQTRN